MLLTASTLLATVNTKYENKIKEQQSVEVCKDSKAIEVKQRGCCSWHGGVAGCSGGRVTCNDGTYSPSCTCNVPQSPLG